MILKLKHQTAFIGVDRLLENESTLTGGSILGTVKKRGVPVTHPCLVVLYERGSMQVLRKTVSDSNGAYKFQGLVMAMRFLVVALDPRKQYNAVIQDNVVPK
jgi:hypothetical protein